MQTITRAFAHLCALDEPFFILNHDLGIHEIVGTRAMLEAEGIIPDGMPWPEGFDERVIESGKFTYWLRRRRPDGAKGPRRDFLECDWWTVRWILTTDIPWHVRDLRQKKKALADALYFQSPAFRAKIEREMKAAHAMKCDKAFQKFLTLIPALNPPARAKPGASIR